MARPSRVATSIVSACCAGAVLLAAPPADAAVDLTGRWYALTSSFYFGQNLQYELDIVQDGTALTIAFRDQPSPFATGTIDPETGAFSLVAQNPLSSFCVGTPPPGSFAGTATSSDLFSATWTTWTGEFVDCFPLAIAVGAKRSQCGLPAQLCAGGPANLTARCCAPTCDEFEAAGTACRLDQNACTRDVCDGAGSCVGLPAVAGTECRRADILCDVAEHCDGISTECPADEFLPAGTLCPDSYAGPCARYVCVDGGGCIVEILPPGGLCRPAFNECSIEQYCGENGDCPSGVPRPHGTPCDADDNPCTVDACNGNFSCAHSPAPDGTGCDDGDPRTTGDICLGGVCAGDLETRLVRDLRPGPDSSAPAALANLGGVLFFVADDGTHGRELWRSDGTSAGTQMVLDLNPGIADAFRHPERLVTTDDALFFGADDGRGGVQLWRSDGTGIGTVLVKDLAAGEPSSVPLRDLMVRDDGTLAFMAATGFWGDVAGVDRLWTSDGTEDGTVIVAELGFYEPGPFGADQFVQQLVPFNGRFLAGILHRTECCETARLVRVELTGQTEALFEEYQGGHRTALYAPRHLTPMERGTLFFTTQANGGTLDCELHRTDGTEAGTMRVELPGMACGLSDLLADRDSLLFARHEQAATALWRVGSSGTDPAVVAFAGRGVSEVTRAGARLFFVSNGGNGNELWKSDGTQEGTVEVRDLHLGGTGANPRNLTIIDGRLLFAADDGIAGPSLWISDGTSAGTVRVGALPSDHTQLFAPFVPAGSDMYFTAYDDAHGQELWAFARRALGGACTGDCDVSRGVDIGELIVSVNIALGTAPVSRCATADFDADGAVTIAELLMAVNHALEGCA